MIFPLYWFQFHIFLFNCTFFHIWCISEYPEPDTQSHYDLPVNSHIPGHYDLPPLRHPPSPSRRMPR